MRGAIGTADSGDTINFAVTGDIILTGGQLTIAKNLAIEGPGSGDLVISGNNDSWVFNIAGGNVAISGMTIQYGGIDNFGTLTLTNTTISGTTPNRVQGGGIFNRGMLTLTNSTVSGNWARFSGGGIDNGGTLTITNSTVSGNSASNGGGIRSSGTVTINNGTIADNTGIGLLSRAGTITLANTIIANRSPGGDCSGSVTSFGYNIDSDGTCVLNNTGDLSNTESLLGPLADNGGPTKTHALLPGSPAIDAGGPTKTNALLPGSLAVDSGDAVSCPATDQRGIPRPQGARCDIGAFEFTGSIPPRAFNQTVTITGDRPVTIVLTASDPDTGDTLTFIIVSPPAGGDLFEGVTITGDKITTSDRVLTGDTVTYGARLGFAGTDSFAFKANDGKGDGNIATVTIVVNQPIVKGAVSLEGMPNPISGARITISTGDQAVARVFSGPENRNFEIQLTSGIYDVKVEKDGFLPATKIGVIVDQDITLPEVELLWGDVNRDAVIGIGDLVVPAKNMGKTKSPWQ